MSIFLDQQSKALYGFLLLYVHVWGLLKYRCRAFASITYSLFQKQRGLKLVFLPRFLHDFWRKIFLMLYSINWPNLIVWLPLFFKILSNICIVTVSFPGCYYVINSEISLLIKLFSTWLEKSGQNCKYLQNEKSF